jgi:two-component system nitrogen regulation sensor histidine kinase GlnL
MLDLLDTGVLELDEQSRILQMNQAAEVCLGAGRDRLLGSSLQQIVFVPEELTRAIEATRQDRNRRHLRECHMAGGLYECTIQSIPESHVLVELYDMKMEQQLLQLQQREVQTGMLDLLRRNLGHELRNPLGGIRGAAQMLSAELQDQELGTLARLIMREVDRIEELIQRFGQPRLSHSKADVHQIIDEAVDLLRAESGGSVNIERDYDPSIPSLPGDASALRQVLLNLVRNAQQASATEIRLRTRVEHGAALLQPGQTMLARIDIEDDGEGVPEELRALLFLPLVTGRRDGTGLGLALAQQIAAAHGGLLSYEALPSGSRFSLRLPLNENEKTTAEAAHG